MEKIRISKNGYAVKMPALNYIRRDIFKEFKEFRDYILSETQNVHEVKIDKNTEAVEITFKLSDGNYDTLEYDRGDYILIENDIAISDVCSKGVLAYFMNQMEAKNG